MYIKKRTARKNKRSDTQYNSVSISKKSIFTYSHFSSYFLEP